MLIFLQKYNVVLMLIATGLSALATVIVAILSYINFKEFKNTRIDESRAYIVFYIEKTSNNIVHELIIKNFGKTAGKLIKINIEPKLDYSKCVTSLDLPLLTESQNIYLAPNQSISSAFDFRNYPDKNFKISLEYETLGKVFKESYDIDYSYRNTIVTASPSIKNTDDALKAIVESIQELTQRLR
ncbi:hypothetical protein [Clostridium ganghwense]|uniref:DUF4230 domain-containing protein n=1 Tax=Clostridium ganghwense TaxID=312089 RepID=A0ABT4CVE6_9CLOT|nr:hypothetical protein [Clostridium ganghwense]MCY6372418.1 hypothetical protein [Clostridium ganghwense]